MAGELEKPTALEGTYTVPFKPEMAKIHPRLLFTRADMERWWKEDRTKQQFIWDAVQDQLNICKGPAPQNEEWNTGDWQKISWWNGLTAVLLYAKTGDRAYARHAMDLMLAMCKSEHWELRGEQDYGMGTGNIMAFVALAYDVTYDLLTVEQRELVRQRLWLAADRFYHYGWNDLKQYPKRSVRYWQGDPQNNHRWHRLCGYLWGTLAIYGEVPGIDGYTAHAIKEAEFVLKWLPTDGSCHESVAYQSFGTQYLVPTIAALDNCTGTNHLGTHRGFREFPHVRAHMVVPNRKWAWSYGDGSEDLYYFSNYNFKCAAVWRDGLMQAAHLANFAAAPNSYIYHGLSLLEHDPTLPAGDLNTYPPHRFFPDMGMATFRQDWSDTNGLACFFKCSVYGGHLLNEYRDSFSPPRYVNVAHDHPDANEFQIFWKGQFFAQDFGTDPRLSSQHSTLMVNGKSQDGASDGYTQPIENMGTRAKVEQYFGAAGWGMVQGQAGKFYDDLDTFTRTFLYVDNAYILIADHIRANNPSVIDWFYKCKGMWEEAGVQQWSITKGNAAVGLRVAAPSGLTATVAKDGLKITTQKITQTRFLALVAPQTNAPARIVEFSETANGFLVKINRGPGTDLIAIGPTPKQKDAAGLQSDADVAVVVQENGRSIKALVINGAKVTCGDFKFAATQKVNALLDGTTGAATMTAPLDKPALVSRTTVAGMKIDRCNSQAMVGELKNGVDLKIPTWQEYQDEADGFNRLLADRVKK